MLQGGHIQNGTEWTVLLFAKCNILQPLVGLDFNARNSVIFSEGFYPPPLKKRLSALHASCVALPYLTRGAGWRPALRPL